MLDDVLKATYSTQDVAFALRHSGFTSFQRELTRADGLILPRKRVPGPGGGEYRYAHIVELAMQLAIGASRGRKLSKFVFWGLVGQLSGNTYALKKINEMPREQRDALLYGNGDWNDDDFPAGTPKNLSSVVDYPITYFSADFISRDNAKPTFMLFDGHPAPGSRASVLLIEDMSLSEAHAKLVEMATYSAGNADTAQILKDGCDDIPLLNLTAMLSRVDKRLQLRLQARDMRGA